MWAAHRITGLIILGFLIIHLYTLGSIIREEIVFDEIMRTMQRPIIKVGELIFLWVLLFHSLNGLRLIMINLFPGINHRAFAYCISIISLILVSISIPVIL